MKRIWFLFLMGLVIAPTAKGQALRDAIKRVDPSVVVIKTVEKNVLPVPQTMFVQHSAAGGFLVQRIADNSPAQKIGLLGGSHRATIAGSDLLVGGDIILSVGGIPVTADGSNELKIIDYLSNMQAGEKVTMKVLRAGEVTELTTLASVR